MEHTHLETARPVNLSVKKSSKEVYTEILSKVIFDLLSLFYSDYLSSIGSTYYVCNNGSIVHYLDGLCSWLCRRIIVVRNTGIAQLI